MTPEPLQNSQQLESDLAWQTERANIAVNRFQEMRAERDALQARIDGALAALKQVRAVPIVRHLIKILTGEGE